MGDTAGRSATPGGDCMPQTVETPAQGTGVVGSGSCSGGPAKKRAKNNGVGRPPLRVKQSNLVRPSLGRDCYAKHCAGAEPDHVPQARHKKSRAAQLAARCKQHTPRYGAATGPAAAEGEKAGAVRCVRCLCCTVEGTQAAKISPMMTGIYGARSGAWGGECVAHGTPK